VHDCEFCTYHLAGCTGDSLDAESIIAVDDLVVGEVDVADSVVRAAADRTDGETVTTSAGTTGEGDACSRVDSNTVILVVNNSIRDSNAGR